MEKKELEILRVLLKSFIEVKGGYCYNEVYQEIKLANGALTAINAALKIKEGES